MTKLKIFKQNFLIFAFVFLSNAYVFAETIDSTPATTYTTIEEDLNNFSNVLFEKRKQLFPEVLKRIENTEDPKKDLYLSRLFAAFSGDDRENYSQKAILSAQKYLKDNPDSYDGYCALARAYQSQLSLDTFFSKFSEWKNQSDIKLYKQMQETVDKALIIQSDDVEAYKIKAFLTEGKEKVELLNRAIEMKENDASLWRALTQELDTRKQYDEALKKLLLWKQTNPNEEILIEIYLMMGKVFREKKEFDSALRWINEALTLRDLSADDGKEQIYSGRTDIYGALADTYLEMKDSTNAEVFLKKYLGIDSDATYIRFKLARLYANTNEKEKAIIEYEQVLGYDENYTSAIYNLGLLVKDSDPERAKELFTKYIALQVDYDSEYSKEWVAKAKSNLNSLGVYTYPKSKKELEAEKSQGFKTYLNIGIFFSILCGLIFLAWKFKNVMKWVILSTMVLIIAFISLNEASSYEPSVVKAFLYFIPVVSIGGFLLYIFRNK